VTTQAIIEPRFVIRGTLNETSGIYTLFLDNGTEVDTDSSEIATAASGYAKAKKPLTIETELRNGRHVITELAVAPTPAPKPTEAAEPVKPDAVATRSAAAGARPELPSGAISDPRALTTEMSALARHYHVMSPSIAISQMAPGYGANLAVVQIDPTVVMDKAGNGAGPDCYYSASLLKDSTKRALNKQGLLKISQAAGVQWVPTQCKRLDDGSQRNLWQWQYVGVIRTHDGALQTIQGSRELDLRDGSSEAAGMKGDQLTKARAVGNQLCETKAMQRAIRTLGIRQVYTVEELKKPFLIVRFSFTPDMADPEIKKAVTLQAMGGIGALYAPPEAPVLPALPETTGSIDDAAGRSTETSAATPAKKVNPFAEQAPAADAAGSMPDGSTTIMEVKRDKGTNAKTQRPWVRYDVTFATGEIASTFSQSLQQLVDDAQQQKARVRITTTEREGYNDSLDSLEIVDKRQQSLPDPGDL